MIVEFVEHFIALLLGSTGSFNRFGPRFEVFVDVDDSEVVPNRVDANVADEIAASQRLLAQ